jgi:hypothetical protein
VAHVLKLQLKSVAAARSTRTAASPLQPPECFRGFSALRVRTPKIS